MPGMAFKCLRDGVHSGNLFFMYGFDGFDGFNYFEKPFCSHVAQLSKLGLKERALLAKFKLQSSLPTLLGSSDFARFAQDGNQQSTPSFPWAMVLQPNPSVQAKWKDNKNKDFPIEFYNRLNETDILYKMFAVPEANSTSLQYLGYIQLTSRMHPSAYGDQTLFFQHTWVENDFKIRKDWQNWISKDKRIETEGVLRYTNDLPRWTHPI